MVKDNNTSEDIEDIEDIDSDDDVDSDLFSITSYGADLTIRELHSMYVEHDLLKPKIQRNFIWNKQIASRFIETILLGLPVPSIFLSLNPNSTYWIVDGLQRITTVSQYIEGIFDDKSVFKLSLSINNRWAGKTFKQLSGEDQRKIKIAPIHAIIFKQTLPKNDDTSLFQIFERINTGGISLSPQEIRNSIYHNSINSKLIELNELSSWKRIIAGHNWNKRMRDVEYILRFFLLIFLRDNDKEESFSFKREMNLLMDTNSSKYNMTGDKSLEKLADIFTKTMDTLEKFDTPFGDNTKWFDNILFDAISVSFASYILEGNEINISNEEFKTKKTALINDPEFISITQNSRRIKYNLIQKRHLIARRVFFGTND